MKLFASDQTLLVHCLGIENQGFNFPDESYAISHDRRGVLSLCNNGKHSNGSEFIITLEPCRWMDTYFVAIGQLIEGYVVLENLESSGTTYECPHASKMISDSGVLPYGRGISVRHEFREEIVDEIRPKLEDFITKVSLKKERGSAMSVIDGIDEVLGKGNVDTARYYLSRLLIQYAPDRYTKPSLEQSILIILLDSVMKTIKLYNVEEDVLDIRDVNSENLLLERYINGIYSHAMADDCHLIELLEKCLQESFIQEAVQYKKELIEKGVLSSSVLGNIFRVKGEQELSQLSSSNISKISASDITVDIKESLKQSITSLIEEAFKYVRAADIGNVFAGEKYIKFKVVDDIIDELLFRVTGFYKRKQISTPIKEKTLRCVTIHFVKSVLSESLRIYNRLLMEGKISLRK